MGNQQAKKQKQAKQKQQQLKKKLQQQQKKQKLIGTALLFLQSQKVQKVPQTQKKLFLMKKGLNQDMIKQAYERIKIKKQEEKNKGIKTDSNNLTNNTKDNHKNGQKKE